LYGYFERLAKFFAAVLKTKPDFGGGILHSLVAMIMEAVQTSETSVNSQRSTRRYNPEDSHLPSEPGIKLDPPPVVQDNRETDGQRKTLFDVRL
jgi:hypothetical protein